jgi:hypothetical protein
VTRRQATRERLLRRCGVSAAQAARLLRRARVAGKNLAMWLPLSPTRGGRS